MKKLEISRVSWHYRLISFMLANSLWGDDRWRYWSSEPNQLSKVRNLCMYGRRFIVAALLFVPLCVLLSPGLVTATLARRGGLKKYRLTGWLAQWWVINFAWYNLANMILAPYPNVKSLPTWVDVFMKFWTISTLGMLAFTVVFMVYGVSLLMKKFRGPKAPKKSRHWLRDFGANVEKTYEGSSLALFAKWLRSKKDKVCLPIEFTS